MNLIPWSIKGIEKVDSVEHMETFDVTWGRDAWGATLTPDKPILHSLHGEAYKR